MILQPWIEGGSAFLLMLLVTPLLIRVAHRFGWIAHPKADRWHKKPTALMGGIAIYCAATTSVIFFLDVQVVLPLWVGGTILFVAGLIDDFKVLRPRGKLLLQLVATLGLLVAGHQFGPDWPIWLSIPLTFLWVIGITNALNLLDNMDGLAAGIAAIVSIVLATFSILEGHSAIASVALIIFGASVGFLCFNFQPARIFMGDSGSLFLGYMLSALALMLQKEAASDHGATIYLVSVAMFAVPILDTGLVSVIRTLTGRSISQGGRDHTSHRLVFLGLSERGAVLMLYGVSSLFGVLGILVHYYDVALFYALLLFSCIGLLIFAVHLGRANVYAEETSGAATYTTAIEQAFFSVLHTILGQRWKALIGLTIDLCLVAASFVLAHDLRFEDGLTAERLQVLGMTLPFLIPIKLIAFYTIGLYRSIWRYAGTSELIRITLASTVASMVSYFSLSLIYDPRILAEGVFLIDWMIFTISAVGIRLSFGGLREFMEGQRQNGKNVLLYGAGDAGVLALREIRQNTEHNMCPVGFVDDDLLKQGLRVNGLPVLGMYSNLDIICEEHSIDEVIISAFRMDLERRVEIVEKCHAINVKCRMFSLSFSNPDVLYNHALETYKQSVPKTTLGAEVAGR